jgi:hypothetical protein
MFSREVRLSHVGNNVHHVKIKLHEQVDLCYNTRGRTMSTHIISRIQFPCYLHNPYAFKLQYYSSVVSKVLTLKKIN